MARQWYRLALGWLTISPTDWQVICLRQWNNTSPTESQKPIPFSGTIKKVIFTDRVWWTLWDWALSTVDLIYNWSNVATISSAVDMSQEHFTAMLPVRIPVTQWTDYINVRLTCASRPTTNPTNVLLNASVRIEF